MASRREINSYSLSTQYKIRPVTLPQENKHNMYKVDYPDNIKDKVKDWLEIEGFPIWHKNKAEYENAIETVHLVIQFILQRLDILGERCQDNTNMFMGKTVKAVFGTKALHITDLIDRCAKYSSLDREHIKSFRKVDIGLELKGEEGNIYKGYDNIPQFTSKLLFNFLEEKMSLTYILDIEKYGLTKLFKIFIEHIEENRETYYDKHDSDPVYFPTILTENTELE